MKREALSIKQVTRRIAFELIEKYTREGWTLVLLAKMPDIIGTDVFYEVEMTK